LGDALGMTENRGSKDSPPPHPHIERSGGFWGEGVGWCAVGDAARRPAVPRKGTPRIFWRICWAGEGRGPLGPWG
jgi:hypothetical protein